MPKTNSTNKAVSSYRLSLEGIRQLKTLATTMGRSESDILEVALDRMYREEVRFNRMVREGNQEKDQYNVDPENEEKNESNRSFD